MGIHELLSPRIPREHNKYHGDLGVHPSLSRDVIRNWKCTPWQMTWKNFTFWILVADLRMMQNASTTCDCHISYMYGDIQWCNCTSYRYISIYLFRYVQICFFRAMYPKCLSRLIWQECTSRWWFWTSLNVDNIILLHAVQKNQRRNVTTKHCWFLKQGNRIKRNQQFISLEIQSQNVSWWLGCTITSAR